MNAFLIWLEQHEKLSGWAQFAGAILGLVVAIGIPAYQTYAARKEQRFASAQRFRATVEVVKIGLKLVEAAKKAIDGNDDGFSYFSNVY